MKNIYELKPGKHSFTYSLFLFIPIFLFFNMFASYYVFAQTITVSRQINILKTREVIETIEFVGGDPKLAVSKIIATVKDSDENDDIISLKVFNPGGTDDVKEITNGSLNAETDNGIETFVIRGVNNGIATIDFTINGTPTANAIDIKVIGVEAKFEVDKDEGEAPLTVDFTNMSTTVNEEKTKWAWDFGDGATSNEKNPGLHEYFSKGFFDVSLVITTETDIGKITIGTSTTICVFSASELANDLLLQGAGTAIFTKSIDVLLNQEVFETILIQDENGENLVNNGVNVVIDSPEIVSVTMIKHKNESQGNAVSDSGNQFDTVTDSNGQIHFIMKGLEAKSTKIKFEISQIDPEPEDSDNVIIKEVDVNVIGVEARIKAVENGNCPNLDTSNSGEIISGGSPLTVAFEDVSPNPGFDITRKWDFGGGERQNVDDDDKCVELQFTEEGAVHYVTLNLNIFQKNENLETVAVGIGGTSTPVFVIPDAKTGVVFGNVFDENTKQPIFGVIVELDGAENRRPEFRVTGIDGGYRFEDKRNGEYLLTVCAGAAYGCITQKVTVDGDTLVPINLSKIPKQ